MEGRKKSEGRGGKSDKGKGGLASSEHGWQLSNSGMFLGRVSESAHAYGDWGGV